MAVRSTVVFNVVEKAVGDLKHGLVGNILVGPGSVSRWLEKRGNGVGWGGWRQKAEGGSLNAKLDALEAFGKLIHKLLLNWAVR